MSHTPGPWRMTEKSIDGYIYIMGANDFCVAEFDVAESTISKYDARLIAVAPELLDALQSQEKFDEEKQAFDDLECFIDDPETFDEYKEEYYRRRKNRMAIAKAEG